jgi:hypothetical protein
VVDPLPDLLAEGGPPATAAGLAAVAARRTGLSRRRLQVVTGAALAVAASMAGLAASPVAPVRAPSREMARSSAPVAEATPAAGAVTHSAGALASPGGSAAAASGGKLRLLFLARTEGVEVRAFLEAQVARKATVEPSDAARACAPNEALVLEVSNRRAVGGLTMPAPTAAPGFVAGASAVIGTAEAAPFELVAARLPRGATAATARFADGRTTAALVRDGWAVAVDPSTGPGGTGVEVVARSSSGRTVATLGLTGKGRWRAVSCPASGGHPGG